MSEASDSMTLTRAELEQLCSAANLGEPQARSRLSKWLDENPGVWQAVAAAGSRSEQQLRQALAGGDFLEQECLRRKTDALKASLLPTDATQLETLAVERVCVCWLGLQLAELRLASSDGAAARATFWIKAVDSAHRRFASAMAQLQAMQKVLRRPACRAAVADVLAGATSEAAAPRGSSRTAPAPDPAAPAAPPDGAPGTTTAPSPTTDIGPVGAPDSPLPDFSFTVPFHMHRPEGTLGDKSMNRH